MLLGAECLVIGEITFYKIVVVLIKTDLLVGCNGLFILNKVSIVEAAQIFLQTGRYE